MIKTEADAIFKDLGIPQEGAQRLVDFYLAKTAETFEQPYKAYEAMTDTWRTEAENHPDLRGKIGAGKEVSVRINRALDGIGDPALVSEFKKYMDVSGIGNHQAFIRVMDYFASQTTEGTHVAGQGPSPAGQSRPGQAATPSAAQALYPHLQSNQR